MDDFEIFSYCSCVWVVDKAIVAAKAIQGREPAFHCKL